MNVFTRIWNWVRGLFNPPPPEPREVAEKQKELIEKAPEVPETSAEISAKIRKEFDKNRFLSELKTAQPMEKQFDPLKQEFIREIKNANPDKPEN